MGRLIHASPALKRKIVPLGLDAIVIPKSDAEELIKLN